MKLLKVMCLLAIFTLTSCGLFPSKKSEPENLSDDIVLADSDVEGDDLLEGIEDVSDQVMDIDDAPNANEMLVSDVEVNSGSTGEYVVQKNDTLMWIAFKIYGDYAMWKKIANMNPGATSGISVGQVLRYNPPMREFNWNPQGNPYLIKRGDTLGLISKSVYGNSGKWRSIYNNNRPMIKNPNIIFAGFTLYYLDNPSM